MDPGYSPFVASAAAHVIDEAEGLTFWGCAPNATKSQSQK
jgi:hypothetical protein